MASPKTPKHQTREERARKTVAKIRKLAADTVETVRRQDNPAIDIPIRALSNVAYDEESRLIRLGDRAQHREFFNVSTARK